MTQKMSHRSPRLGTGKGHATVVSSKNVSDALRACLAARDDKGTAMFLVAVTTGLRAFQLASLTWDQVLDANGSVGTEIRVPLQKTKGKRESRTLPIPPKTVSALKTLRESTRFKKPSDPIFVSERTGEALQAQSVVDWFRRLWRRVGVQASAHSARRYFITQAAKAMSQAQGSTKDLMYLAQHRNFQTTSRYIDTDPEAQGKMTAIVAQQLRI